MNKRVCSHLAQAHRFLATATKHLSRAKHEGSAVARTGVTAAYDVMESIEREQDAANCPLPKKRRR